MDDSSKTRDELLAEIEGLRRRLSCGPSVSVFPENSGEPGTLLQGDWNAVFDTVGSAIWVMDQQCRITAANRACATLFQRTVDEMIGRRCWQVVHGTASPIACCPVALASKTKSRETTVVERDGRWFEFFIDVIVDLSNQIVGYIHIANDITDRKRAQESLQIRERQLRAIIEAASESVFLMDTDGRVEFVNETSAQRLKTQVATLTGANMYDFVAPEVAARRKKHVQQVIATGQPTRFVDERNGLVFHNSIYPVKNQHGQVTHLAVFGLDITEERQAKNEAEESRRKLTEVNNLLHLVIDTIPVRIFWKNLDSVFLGCNKLFAADAGKRSPDDLIGKSDFDMTWRNQAEQYVSDDRLVVQTGVPKINYEEPQDTPSGQRIWLRTTKVPLRDQSGIVFGVLGTYEDITEKKVMEELLRESEERYRGVFQNNHAVMLIIDPETGKIVDANPAACHYYGWSLSELQGRWIMDINTLSSDQVKEEMDRAKEEQRQHFLFSHRLASGEIRPVEVFSGPILQEGKQLLYSIIHDISERKKAEDDRERLIVELQDALGKIKVLSGMLPICSSCKKIRDDRGCWNHLESYIKTHSQAEFTHSICPDCAIRLYPELYKRSE